MRRVSRWIFLAVMLVEVCACQPRATAETPTSSPSTTVSPPKPIVQPDAGMQPVVGLLNSAQKTIRIEMYLLTDREIIDALKAACGRGVDGRVIVEAQPTGGGSGNRSRTERLASRQRQC